MSGHVDPDFVQESARAHGHPEVLHGLVQLVHRDSRHEQVTRLVQIGAQNSIHEEARTVAADHRDLPHPDRQCVDGGQGIR